jgi:hypothetical protein
MKRFILATAIISLGTIFGALAVTAADETPLNASGQALEIAPPVINLKADPGETLTTKVSLRGISDQTLLVRGQVNDFVAAGEDGTPKILLDTEDGEDDPYSLKGWVSTLPELTLKPREIQDMTLTIRVPSNAAPGGYYGVVRFTATPPELKDTGVSLSASLGSLLFIRVNGEATEGLEIAEFATSNSKDNTSLFESAPIQFVERVKNTGNTHLQPAGQITVKDMFGQKVATVNINLPPRNVLPNSIRKFEQPLDSATLGDKMLFGRYTAELNITYGDSRQTLTTSIDFWVIPYKLIIGIIIGLIALFFLIRLAMQRYKRTILRSSQGGGLTMRSRRK